MGAAHAETDFELLDQWTAGNLVAGNQLFEKYFDAIHRFFLAKGGAEAPDLVQRTFLGCLESHGRFERRSSFRTFLYAIARNVLHEHWRERSRRDLDLSVSTMRDLSPSPSTLLRQHERGRLLTDALRAIPIDLQLALELYYWEHLTASELAEVFEIPEGTVRSRLRRGQEALRERLAELDPSADSIAAAIVSLEGSGSAAPGVFVE